MEIIPAIDIIDGKCVRLSQGDYSKRTVYDQAPLDLALQYEDVGIQRLHLVDLDGARQGRVINYKVLEKIAARTKLKIDFGGGIKTGEAIQNVFDSGAAIAAIGSVAVKEKMLFQSWIIKYGSERILPGADVKGEKITISGWLEQTDILLEDFIAENMQAGITNIFCTDVAKDGLLSGPSVDLYKEVIRKFPQLNLIASGGVSSVADLDILKEIGCSGVIIGKAIYEDRIKLNELKNYL
ncbi:MAG: 1-(5-phosphoribosyl)-5-[(5-phosphoribosylamino)methylideneamino]imidazole-4-carboxamide isomerase [Bacteroidia bacterium]